MSEPCCCSVDTSRGVFGEQRCVIIKCFPAALDLGHCYDDGAECIYHGKCARINSDDSKTPTRSKTDG